MSKTAQRKISTYSYGKQLYRNYRDDLKGKDIDFISKILQKYKKIIRKNSCIHAGFQSIRLRDIK